MNQIISFPSRPQTKQLPAARSEAPQVINLEPDVQAPPSVAGCHFCRGNAAYWEGPMAPVRATIHAIETDHAVWIV